jgi:hypothetical protein
MSFNSSLSYKTYNLDKIIILSAAILLMISAMQDFLDPIRRMNLTVIIQALVRLLLGLFMVYFFATVLKQS